MTWREYHEVTKHSAESLRRNRHYLDWANMPNPFRHYEDVPILDLPSDPPAPQISALEVLEGKVGNTSARVSVKFLREWCYCLQNFPLAVFPFADCLPVPCD